MKVYVVTSGEYSDYHIDAVFIDRYLAYKYATVQQLKNRWSSYDVETYDTDDIKMADVDAEEEEIRPHIAYRCEFLPDGTLQEGRDVVKEKWDEPVGEGYYNKNIVVYVPKGDKSVEECVKVAQDMRAKYLAEKFGL